MRNTPKYKPDAAEIFFSNPVETMALVSTFISCQDKLAMFTVNYYEHIDALSSTHCILFLVSSLKLGFVVHSRIGDV